MAMFSEVLAARGVSAPESDALVFVSADGTPLDYSNWRLRVWLPARAVAGLPTLNFHDLKDTALLDERINIKTGQHQARLGPRQPRDNPGVLRPGHGPGGPGGRGPAGQAYSWASTAGRTWASVFGRAFSAAGLDAGWFLDLPSPAGVRTPCDLRVCRWG
jgi:hypothetical protein